MRPKTGAGAMVMVHLSTVFTTARGVFGYEAHLRTSYRLVGRVLRTSSPSAQ